MAFAPIATKGLIVERAGSGFELVPVVLDDMRPDEVLVEMMYSGICHTDVLAAAGGYEYLDYPVALGHEGAGIIRAIGPEVQDSSLQVGSSVILSFNHCGNCRNCYARHPACCTNFETLNIVGKRLADQSTPAKLPDGRRVVSQFFGQSSFLKHSVVSQRSIVLCPYPDELAAYAAMGCGFQTGAGTVLKALNAGPGDSIVIFGVGTVGLAALMAAKYRDLRHIIAVDVVGPKLVLAKELGATHVINSIKIPRIAEEIQIITDGGARFAVDCTGNSLVMEQFLDSVCAGGTAAVVGVPKADFELKVDPMRLLHENKSLRGICQGDSIAQQFIPELIELHRSGHFPLEKLCTFYDLDQFDQALSDVRAGATIKPIFCWSAESHRFRNKL